MIRKCRLDCGSGTLSQVSTCCALATYCADQVVGGSCCELRTEHVQIFVSSRPGHRTCSELAALRVQAEAAAETTRPLVAFVTVEDDDYAMDYEISFAQYKVDFVEARGVL